MNQQYTDTKIIYNWWRSVDRTVLIFTLILILIGGLVSFAATPSVAEKYNLDHYFLVKKHRNCTSQGPREAHRNSPEFTGIRRN